jgi:hypothetical protein
MASLSQRFGERDAQMPAGDPVAAAQSRQAALRAYDRERRRKLNLALAAAVAALALGDLAYIFLGSTDKPGATPSTAIASSDPPAQIEATAATPRVLAPAPQTQPPPAEPAAPVRAAQAATPDPASADLSPPTPSPAPTPSATPASAPDPGKLKREEIREVQVRLRGFGFNPGPPDGNAGPMTEAAAARYQQDRTQTATGKVDRQLLDQLRQDSAPPVPQVAQASTQPTQTQRPSHSVYASAAPPPQQRSYSNGPLDAIRRASDRLSAWFQANMPR